MRFVTEVSYETLLEKARQFTALMFYDELKAGAEPCTVLCAPLDVDGPGDPILRLSAAIAASLGTLTLGDDWQITLSEDDQRELYDMLHEWAQSSCKEECLQAIGIREKTTQDWVMEVWNDVWEATGGNYIEKELLAEMRRRIPPDLWPRAVIEMTPE